MLLMIIHPKRKIHSRDPNCRWKGYDSGSSKKYDAEEIILAIPSAGTKATREILRICNLTDCKLKILPGMYQLINDEVGVSNLREVSIEDLLGRDTIDIDMESVGQYVSNKRVLVTGGGGSIGSELCRQIASHNPKAFDHI